MDAETKQRHRRRKRAQRMAQAQREMAKDGDSGEDESPVREKPQRPPNRRKKSKEPLVEEDIIDGFAILGFKSYEDLELALKLATQEKVKRLAELERPKHESRPHIITHHISAHHPHGLTLSQDPATSDDSGRASERLTGSSVAPRDADSSRDRLSDASSRCSSGKGYICDSEGDDDKGSDASSVIFGSAPASRKHEFPGALPPSLPLSNGTSNSPVPAPTPPDLPVPLPAPAQLPPPPPQHTTASAVVRIEEKPPPPSQRSVVATPMDVSMTVAGPPNSSSPATSAAANAAQQPPPAAAPVVPMMPPHDLTPASNRSRTESPAVATSAPVYHPPYQPLYTPYSQTTYTAPSIQQQPLQQQPSQQVQPPPATTAPTASVVTTTVAAQGHGAAAVSTPPTPRGHSPSRERESYSSNVSSLSRSSVATPQNSVSGCPQPQPAQPTAAATTVSSSLSLGKSWSAPTPNRHSPAPPRPTPPLHQSYPPPMFAAPLPPSTSTVSRASPLTPTVPPQAPPSNNPNPFSAESLFQTNQTDMLRRELDNRFLATQDRSLNVAPPPYLRTEMHQHQHHHTHVHQHTTSLLPPPPASTLFPSPLFKEIPKLGSVESPFYRQNMGMPNYPGYTTPSLLHPGLTAGPTPFVPPNHLGSFQPKTVVPPDPTKPKPTKTGKWNAMHVRIAWEIYHHQQKSGEAKSGPAKDLLRPPTHLFSPSVHSGRPHELPFPPSLAHRPPAYEQPPPHHSSLFAAPGSHIGSGYSFKQSLERKLNSQILGSAISPFTRYGATGFGPTGASPFSVSPFANSRDMGLQLHDPWRGLQRTVPTFPSVSALPPSLPGLPPPAPWGIKPDPLLEQREREERERQERERERLRREREERERREREEKQRRLEQQQQQERERERREKERREQERLEREQRERERLLHQQRLAESSKQLNPVLRDRSPIRNGLMDHSEVRIKEEPRPKEEETLSRTADPRYHPYLRPPQHSMQPPSMMDRARMLGSSLGHHYQPPPASHWPPPTDYYRYDHLRYNPLLDAMRVEEERAKLFGGYPPHPSQLRTKDPGLMHLRPGPGPPPLTHKLCATPPTDLHKKEEPR